MEADTFCSPNQPVQWVLQELSNGHTITYEYSNYNLHLPDNRIWPAAYTLTSGPTVETETFGAGTYAVTTQYDPHLRETDEDGNDLFVGSFTYRMDSNVTFAAKRKGSVAYLTVNAKRWALPNESRRYQLAHGSTVDILPNSAL